MKVHPIPHAIFETARSGFIQIFHHCSVSWKITPLYFFSSNLIYFGKFTKSFMSYLKPQVSFSLNFASLFSVMKDNSSVLFSWSSIWFGQKKPIKEQNFKLSTAHVNFHQICTLIGSFCWKYIKFQLKKCRGVMSHDAEEWCQIWKKLNLLFQKWQEFGEFWSEHSKDPKICTLIGLFRAKYIPFNLKKYRRVYFMTLKSHSKFEEKLENDIRNLANFHQNTLSKLGLWLDPFVQSRKCMS